MGADRPDHVRGVAAAPAMTLEAIRLENEAARALEAVRGGLQRPWRFVPVKDQDARYVARPWDCVLADAYQGQMRVLLPNPTAVENIGTQIAVMGVGTRSHAIRVEAIGTGTQYHTAGPEGALIMLATGRDWSVLGRTNGNAAPRFLNAEYSPVGLFGAHLGRTVGFLDYSGNGNTVTLEGGTERWTWIHPAWTAVRLDGATSWYVSTFQSELAITGAMSAIAVASHYALPGAGVAVLLSHSAAGETEATNALYDFDVNTTGQVTYTHEQGAGVNETLTQSDFIYGPGRLNFCGFTRSAGGVVRIYVNNRQVGAASAALTMPTGGGDGRFRIGSFANAVNTFWTGDVMQVALYARELSGPEMLERYNYAMSRAYGVSA